MSCRTVTAILLAAAACGAGGFLVSCSEPQEPTSTGRPQDLITIRVEEGSIEQQVMATLYKLKIEAQVGTFTYVEFGDSARGHRLDWLTDGDTDVVVGCTGELLAYLNPDSAGGFVEEADTGADEAAAGPLGQGSGKDAEERSYRVYEELMGSLSFGQSLPDPSPAQGCIGSPDYSDALPQNVVPVFSSGAIDRYALKALNGMTRLVTTQDLEEIVEETEERGGGADAATDAATEWYGINAAQGD